MTLAASLIFFDYLLFCFHAEKNPFDIMPSFPVKDERYNINIYVPETDAKSLIKERRKVLAIHDNEIFINYLFQMVMQGSEYENTSIVIPVHAYIRKIWIYRDTCIIDAGFSSVEKDAAAVSGSEKLFKQALSKTIKENISSIKYVIFLDRGIPDRSIWDLKAQL